MKHRVIACRFLTFAAVLVLACGCATTKFREIQADFNAAAQADNVQTVNAVGVFAAQGSSYDDVLAALSDDLIDRLNDKLKGNAYTMRAIAQWRTGKSSMACETARLALNDRSKVPTLGARDRILLRLMRALAVDGDLMSRFSRLPHDEKGDVILPNAIYWSDYPASFRLAVSEIDKILSEAADPIPPEVMDYARFQKWRVLQNWRIVATRISGDNRLVLRNAAVSAEATGLKKSLNELIDSAKKDAEHSPLFKVMQALERKGEPDQPGARP